MSFHVPKQVSFDVDDGSSKPDDCRSSSGSTDAGGPDPLSGPKSAINKYSSRGAGYCANVLVTPNLTCHPCSMFDFNPNPGWSKCRLIIEPVVSPHRLVIVEATPAKQLVCDVDVRRTTRLSLEGSTRNTVGIHHPDFANGIIFVGVESLHRVYELVDAIEARVCAAERNGSAVTADESIIKFNSKSATPPAST